MNELQIDLLHTNTVDVKRAATGKYIGGHYKKGSEELFLEIDCSVQPTEGKDLKKLPEYAKETDSHRFFSEDFAFKKADIITWQDEDYEVLHLEPWDKIGLNTDHSYAIGVLVDNRKRP